MKKSASTSPIRLYGLVPFDRAAKVRWVLNELGLDFENRWLNGEKKEHEGADFLKLNPMGRVPVLEIDDIVMFESSGICAYLADRYLDRGLAPELASPARADYQKWMYFAVTVFDSIQTRIMAIEDIPAGALYTGKEAVLLADLQDALTAIDVVLEKSSYLVSNKFSVADICVGYHLYWCTLWPELNTVIKTFPRVTAYYERLMKMPSAVKADVFSYKK